MAQTRTHYVTFDRLLSRGRSAATVVKLMMACNDLSLANEALSEWKREQPGAMRFRQAGAKVYFVQLEFSHLHEALIIVGELRQDPALMSILDTCNTTTKDSFKNLEPFLIGGAQRELFEQRVGRIRNNLAFHYEESGRLIERAIANRAGRAGSAISSITRGSSMRYWRFNVADDIIDSIVVRQLWEIPLDVDPQAEIDKVADWAHEIELAFVDFAGDFIWKYCEA